MFEYIVFVNHEALRAVIGPSVYTKEKHHRIHELLGFASPPGRPVSMPTDYLLGPSI